MANLKGTISKFFAWIMVSIVIISLAGFGIQDVIVGSTGRNIATIGKEKISINEFLRGVESEILNHSRENNVNLTIEEAKNYGLINKALNNLIAKKIFDDLIKNKEISRDSKSVANYITTVETFKNISGDFDVEKYKRYVATTGVDITEFENTLKDDLTRDLILDVFEAPTTIDTTILEKSIAHYFQSRDVSFIELETSTFRNLSKEPTSTDISKYFDDKKHKFKSPNKKIFKIGYINFQKLVEQQKINDQSIEEYYNENIGKFRNEEKRLIDMLSFSDIDNKNGKRIKEIKSNPKIFNEEITSRGLKIDDITLGYIKKSSVTGNENLVKLFDEETIGVYGPYETDLGFAVYRIREILEDNQVTFSDAKSDIRNLLASEKAKNESFKTLENLNNEVAAGRTLEDLESLFSISTETLEIENNELPDKFKIDPSTKALFDNAGDQITEFTILADNSLLAIRLDKEIKTRSLELTEASEDIAKILRKDNTLVAAQSYFDKKLIKKNESFITQLFEMNIHEDVFKQIGKKKVFRFNIDTRVTQKLMERIFSLKENEFLFFYDESKLFIAYVETITPDDIDEELKSSLLAQRKEFLKRSLRQNFINNYLNFIKQNIDININESLIESTLSNLQRTG